MSFIYQLLQIPPLILLIIIVLIFSGISFLITYCFRKYVKISPKQKHNEAVSYIFAIIGGFYALLLGFVVFMVWGSSDNAQIDTSYEGSSAIAFYRDINYFPSKTEILPIKTAYMKYVHTVIEHDFPAMEKMEPLDKNSRTALNKVFLLVGKLGMKNAYSAQILNQLNELSMRRSLRQVNNSSSIPFEIWIPLLLGGIIVMIFALLLDVESLRIHLLINTLLGAFIGLVIFIIVQLDHPFTGDMKIEPNEYKTILMMDKETNNI
ncbi:DUF4239 domain-containing protein [Flavobacterium sp.]|uniref:bestrophin-like domain n=1 Tax=Flavobacterium sp. TaxID=239 RepID=UPI0025D678D5|nr:DUF4239 domain-containing protein [Flavobacterium sp.]